MLTNIILLSLGTILIALLILWLIGERGRVMLPSTWAGMKAGGLRNILNMNALHMYVYGRWTGQYLNILLKRIYPRLNKKGLKKWRDHYHGKVLTQDQANAIIMLDHDIELRNLEQVIPYPAARDLILNGPPDIIAYECGCRYTRENPCQPTQVCLVVGKPFTDFILEHTPQKARRLTQSEALELVKAEHDRGHMHSAWFKDACLDRFYSICNCCKCCCGGVETMKKYNSNTMASSGYISRVDEQNCIACGKCAEACPFDAITVEQKAVVNWEKCMGCGVCTSQCPSDCMTLIRDEKKGIPMDVRLLA